MTRTPKELAMAVLQMLISSVVVWLLWNALISEIFGLRGITWIQALGLMMFANLTIKR